jgi:hypothetical protein
MHSQTNIKGDFLYCILLSRGEVTQYYNLWSQPLHASYIQSEYYATSVYLGCWFSYLTDKRRPDALANFYSTV